MDATIINSVPGLQLSRPSDLSAIIEHDIVNDQVF